MEDLHKRVEELQNKIELFKDIMSTSDTVIELQTKKLESLEQTISDLIDQNEGLTHELTRLSPFLIRTAEDRVN